MPPTSPAHDLSGAAPDAPPPVSADGAGEPGGPRSVPWLPLPRIAPRPDPPARSERVTEIIMAGRAVLEAEGPDALTMRRVGDEVGIRAASLYKHLPGKPALEAAIVNDALFEHGDLLHSLMDALGTPGDPSATDPTGVAQISAVGALISAYRRVTLSRPAVYRLATSGQIDRTKLTPGLDEWSGEPFYRATGDPWIAQALFAAAHGGVTLEMDRAYSNMSDLDATWRAIAHAFTQAAVSPAPPPYSG